MLLLNAKMTKMTYQIKPHIFFLFFMTAFSETWTGILWFHGYWGFKIETKGGFIETWGFGGCGGRNAVRKNKKNM